MDKVFETIDSKFTKLENTTNFKKKIKIISQLQNNIQNANEILDNCKDKLDNISNLQLDDNGNNGDNGEIIETEIEVLIKEINELKSRIETNISIEDKLELYNKLKTKILLCKKHYSKLELKINNI